MVSTLPAGAGIFWENLSSDSLCEDEFHALIAEDESSPFYRPRSRRPAHGLDLPPPTARQEPPTHIALPTPFPPPTRRSSLTRDKKVGSPKLSGWAFLKRAAGPSSLPPLALQQAHPTNARPLSAHPGTTTSSDLHSASANTATKRPANSRSTTFTDTLPTTRALTLDPPASPPPPQVQARLTPNQPYYPPSPHTAAPHPTLAPPATPPIVVVPSVLAPKGRFGLFRRPSLSPKVERGGFFAGLVSPSLGSASDLAGIATGSAGSGSDKKRLKGLGRKQRASLGGPVVSSSSGSASPSEHWGGGAGGVGHMLSPPQPPFAPSSSSRFASGSSTHSSFQRPASPLSPYYQPPDPSYRHTTSYPATGSPVHSPSPTLYHQPASPSRGPNRSSPSTTTTPTARQPRIPDRDSSIGRPSLDFHPGRGAIAFPVASGSASSLSAAEGDDDEDFPFRDARPAKVSSSKRKNHPNSQRGRSCSPSRLTIVDGPPPDALEPVDRGGTSPAKTARAWWKLAVDGGLAQANDRASRGPGMLGSSAPTPRASIEGGTAGTRSPKRGSTLDSEPKVVERGFKVISRPESPAGSFRMMMDAASARTPERSRSRRSSVLVVRNGPLSPDEKVVGTAFFSSPPPPPPQAAPSPTPPRMAAASSPMVSRSNSLASPRSGSRLPSRSNSINNRSWTPPLRAPPKPPSTPGSSRPGTPSRRPPPPPIETYHPAPHVTSSGPMAPSPSFLASVPDPRFVDYPPLPPSPHFFNTSSGGFEREDRVSPTFSSSDSSGGGGHGSRGGRSGGGGDATMSRTTFATTGTNTTTEAETEEDEVLTSEAETTHMHMQGNGVYEGRRGLGLAGGGKQGGGDGHGDRWEGEGRRWSLVMEEGKVRG